MPCACHVHRVSELSRPSGHAPALVSRAMRVEGVPHTHSPAPAPPATGDHAPACRHTRGQAPTTAAGTSRGDVTHRPPRCGRA
eukprot:361885-Chlamydomonas_euryale.AAC.16